MTTEQNIEAILETCFTESRDDLKEIALRSIMNVIPKHRTGHWVYWTDTIYMGKIEAIVSHCKCSECNKMISPYEANSMKYCYECGAKMETERNDQRRSN